MKRSGAYLQLVRAANTPTAVADILAGALLVGVGAEQLDRLAFLCGASVCLYSGGMALNDVADAHRDALLRPERPIPSGRVSRRSAAILSIVLLGAGLGLAAVADCRHASTGGIPGGYPATVLATVLIGFIVAYDLLLKATPLAPAAMGMCRSLNLMLGMSLAMPLIGKTQLSAVALIWVYITSVTLFARKESQAGTTIGLRLGWWGMWLAIVGLAAFPLVSAANSQWHWIGVLVLAGLMLRFGWPALCSAEPDHVQQAVKTMVLAIILVDATLVLAVRGLLPGMVVALLLLPSIGLSRVLRVT